MAYIYLLHFDRPISPGHTCQHYTGSADDIEKRIQQHQQGQGSRLTQVAYEREIQFSVVRLWMGNRMMERRLKRLKCSPKFCPICNPQKPWTLLKSNLQPAREVKHISKRLGALCN